MNPCVCMLRDAKLPSNAQHAISYSAGIWVTVDNGWSRCGTWVLWSAWTTTRNNGNPNSTTSVGQYTGLSNDRVVIYRRITLFRSRVPKEHTYTSLAKPVDEKQSQSSWIRHAASERQPPAVWNGAQWVPWAGSVMGIIYPVILRIYILPFSSS